MLAQNFKTAADLGISDKELDALIKVLWMLERGEIQHRSVDSFFEATRMPKKISGFNMFDFYTQGECGTACCLCGWAEFVGGLKPYKLAARRLYNPALEDLFEPDRSLADREEITASQAATALRSYLTTGKANWADALACAE